MTMHEMDCDEVLARFLDHDRGTFACEPVGEAGLLVTMPHEYADGGRVQLVVREADGGRLLVSDFGTAYGRLGLAGLDVASARLRAQVLRSVRSYSVAIDEDELYAEGTVVEAGALMQRMASLALTVDGLSSTAKAVRPPRFDTSLLAFLQDAVPAVRAGHRVRGSSGSGYRPTATVGPPGEQTLIQAVPASSADGERDAATRAFRTFSDLSAVPAHQKLAVFEATAGSPVDSDMRLLAEVAYVGIWEQRDLVVSWLNGDGPLDGDRVLVEPSSRIELPTGD